MELDFFQEIHFFRRVTLMDVLGASTAALLPLLLPGIDESVVESITSVEKKPRKKRKTFNENPKCPWCNNEDVINSNAHSVGKRVYDCVTKDNPSACGKKWQQIPPFMLKPGQDPEVQECKKRKVKGGGYKCGKCGQLCKIYDPTGQKPPVSHDCPNKQDKVKRAKLVDMSKIAPIDNVSEANKKANAAATSKISVTISTQTDTQTDSSFDDPPDFPSGIFPENPAFPGVYESYPNSEQDEFPPLDALRETCLVCGQFGTHYAGDEKSFLKCMTCSNVVHYCCLDEFSEEWSCQACSSA